MKRDEGKQRSTSRPPVDPQALTLSWSQVALRLGVDSSTAWRRRKADPRFPRSVRTPLGGERWVASELERYVEKLKADRDAEQRGVA